MTHRAPVTAILLVLLIGSIPGLTAAISVAGVGATEIAPPEFGVVIVSPEDGDVYPPDSTATVTWRSPVNDQSIGLDNTYRVEVLRPATPSDGEEGGSISAASPVDTSVRYERISVATDYGCDGNVSAGFRCSATVALGDPDDYTIRVSILGVDGLDDINGIGGRDTTCANTLALCDEVVVVVTATLARVSPAGSSDWRNTNPMLNLSCASTTACRNIEYRFSTEQNWARYSQPFALPGDGQWSLLYHAVGQDGNAEATQMANYSLDTVAPVTTLRVNGAAPSSAWYTAVPTLAFTCSDASSGCSATLVSVNGEDAVPASELTLPGEGVYALNYHSLDVAGNMESALTTTLRVDLTDPTPSIVTTPADTNEAGWFKDAVSVELACADTPAESGCALDYRLGTGVRIPYQGAFLLPADGVHSLDVRAIDGAARSATVTGTLRQDTVAPVSTATLSITSTASGWYASAPSVTLACSDARSGMLRIDGVIETADEVTEFVYSGPFTVGATTGSYTVAHSCVDVAGNVEDARTFEVRQDLDNPLVTVCPSMSGSCSTQEFTTRTITALVPASDVGSGLASVTVWATRGSQSTTPTTIMGDSTTLDLVSILDELVTDVYHGNGIVLHARAVDNVGRVTEVQSAPFTVDESGLPRITLQLADNPERFLPDGTPVSVTYQATWTGGPSIGSAAAGTRVRLTDANDGAFVREAVTDLSGLVTFTLADSNVRRVIENTVTGQGETIIVPAPALDVVWTTLTLARVGDSDLPRTTLYANPGEIYRAAYRVTTNYNGEGLANARVTLTDGDLTFSALTSATGDVRVPLSYAEPSRVTFTVGMMFDHPQGPVQVVTGDDLTLTWAKLVIDNLAVVNGDAAQDAANALEAGIDWHDLGDLVTYSYDAHLVFGPNAEDKEAAVGTVVTFTSDSVDTDTIDGTAHVAHTRTSATPHHVTPAIAFVSNPLGIGANAALLANSVFIDVYDEQRWATVVLDELTAVGDGNSAAGWHDVTDTVTFGFRARLQYGAADFINAENAVVTFTESPGVSQDYTVDGTGLVSDTRMKDVVTDITPVLTLVSTTQAVTATDIGSYARQRWTEISLAITSADEFVKVGDSITYAIAATYAHDENQNGETDDVVSLVDLTYAQAEETCSFDASADCSLAFEDDYAEGLTFVVSGSENGITRQLGGVDATRSPVWTRIVVSACANDNMVDFNTNVVLTCTATWEHNDAAVESAVLQPTSTLPDGCSRIAGDVAMGALTATILCDTPTNLAGENAVSWYVASSFEDVSGDGAISPDALGIVLDAKWAKVVFTPTVPDGWHEVDEDVAFDFLAEYVFGATEADRSLATGAAVDLAAGTEVHSLVTDAEGRATTVFDFQTVADVVPALSLTATPEGVTLQDAADYGRQRWTEILIAVSSADEFVDANTDITYAVTGTYLHDEDGTGAIDLVADLELSVINALDETVATCSLATGAGDCAINLPTYDDGLTFLVTSSQNAILRQALDTPTTVDPVWTRIVVTNCDVTDALVNKADEVTMACDAAYEHDLGMAVGATTLALGPEADGTCTMTDGSGILAESAGMVAIGVACDTVRGDLTVPFVVEANDMGVTTLANALTLTATWTRVHVATTVVAGPSTLNPNEAVTFQNVLTYEHNGARIVDGVVSITSADGEEFPCLTGNGEPGNEPLGECTLQISKSQGAHTFTVAGFSTVDDAGMLDQDITLMDAVPETYDYRWTAIAFEAPVCKVGGIVVDCSAPVALRTRVEVTAKAVPVDGGACLVNAEVTLGGSPLTTDENCMVTKSFIRFSAGTQSANAVGIRAYFGPDQITATVPSALTLRWT